MDKKQTTVATLLAPKVTTRVASVVGISERKAGDKFKKDTMIVSLRDVTTGEVFDVFITVNQWKEYGCKNYYYNGNVVSQQMEECIAGVTGYKESADSAELTAHDTTFAAFHRVLNVDNIGLMTTLSSAGFDVNLIGMVANNLAQVRAMFDKQLAAAKMAELLPQPTEGFAG